MPVGEPRPRGTVTELEFRLRDRSYPLVEASADAGCRFVLEDVFPGATAAPLEFYTLRGAAVEPVVETLREYVGVEPRPVDAFDDGGVLQLRVRRRSPVVTLGAAGAISREFVLEDGEGRLVAEVLPGTCAETVCDQLLADHPAAEMVAKRDPPGDCPTFTRRQLRSSLEELLTDRQQEVLTAAYLGGYYDDPRRVTGAELADRLGIASSTFANHLRAAERAVFSLVFDEGLGTGPDDAVE